MRADFCIGLTDMFMFSDVLVEKSKHFGMRLAVFVNGLAGTTDGLVGLILFSIHFKYVPVI